MNGQLDGVNEATSEEWKKCNKCPKLATNALLSTTKSYSNVRWSSEWFVSHEQRTV